MDRAQLLENLADLIIDIEITRPIRVGIDGPDASGKTTFANELKLVLEEKYEEIYRKIILASIDGFHNSSKIRYQKGRDSPEGYYLDSFNYESLIRVLLDPLSSDGNLEYQTAIFDYLTNQEIKSETKKASEDSVLLVEGIFLFRPELVDYWDFKIFIDVDFEIAQRRATKRVQDQLHLGDSENILKKYQQRYIPGQKLYFTEVDPRSIADVVVDNNDFDRPEIVIKR